MSKNFEDYWKFLCPRISNFYNVIVNRKDSLFPTGMKEKMELYDVTHNFVMSKQSVPKMELINRINKWIQTDYLEFYNEIIINLKNADSSEIFFKKLNDYYKFHKKFIKLCDTLFTPIFLYVKKYENNMQSSFDDKFNEMFIVHAYTTIHKSFLENLSHLINNNLKFPDTFTLTFTFSGIDIIYEIENFMRKIKKNTKFIKDIETCCIENLSEYVSIDMSLDGRAAIDSHTFSPYLFSFVDRLENLIEKINFKDENKKNIYAKLYDITIVKNLPFIHDEFKYMIQQNIYDSPKFSQIYSLLTKVQSDHVQVFDDFGKNLSLHIDSVFQNIFTMCKSLKASQTTIAEFDKFFFTEYLTIKSQIKSLISDYFDNNVVLQKCMFDSFCENLKKKVSREIGEIPISYKEMYISEIMARFCDGILRQTYKDIVESREKEYEIFEEISIYLSYESEKDIFCEVYKHLLIKRLLMGNYDIDSEKYILSKIKGKYGYSLMRHSEMMINDFEISKDINRDFTGSISFEIELGESKKNFACAVISSNNLSISAISAKELVLHPDLQRPIDLFQTYYATKFHSRKLMWSYNHFYGTAELAFPKGKKEFTMSAYQINALKYIDDLGKITIRDLLEITKMDINIFKTHISPLYTNNNIKILEIEPDASTGEKQEDLANVKINENFIHKMRKINLLAFVGRNIIAPKDNVDEKLDTERKFRIEACIVRIMKSRKIFSHPELLNLVIVQLSSYFVPNIKQIKIVIDNLIEREYLQRSANDANMLEYLI
jgi:cullin 1